MARRCIICGKVLTKTQGPVGPRCLKKNMPKKFFRAKKFDYFQENPSDITLPSNTKNKENEGKSLKNKDTT